MANTATRATEVAIVTLLDRKGFDSWWDELDDEIKQEIKEEMAEAIDKVIDG